MDGTSSGLTVVATAIDFMVELIGDAMTIITGNPVLCLGIAMWCAGGAIGLFKRLV